MPTKHNPSVVTLVDAVLGSGTRVGLRDDEKREAAIGRQLIALHGKLRGRLGPEAANDAADEVKALGAELLAMHARYGAGEGVPYTGSSKAKAFEDADARLVQLNATPEQAAAFAKIKSKWSRVGSPQGSIGCDGCIMVEVFYKDGGSMWLGIEKDGYTHS